MRTTHTITAGVALLTLASWADSTASYGSSIRVPAGETRDGDIVALGGSVVVEGTVTQDVTVIGGDTVINGTVGHDLTSFGGHVILGPHASVGHDVVIVAGSLSRDPHAKIGGQVVRGQPTVPFLATSGSRLAQLRGLSLAFGAGTAFAITLIALVLLLVFPRQLQTTSATVAQRPLESLAIGCGGTIAGVTLAVVLAITVIGIPASLAIGLAMTAGWLFGWAAIFLASGERLLRVVRGPQQLVPALLIGAILAGILANIPRLGLVVILVGGNLALGASIYSRLGTHNPYRLSISTAVPPGPSPPVP